LPEAHCYIRFAGKRIDATRSIATVPAEIIARFLYEEVISPDQIGAYKVGLHQHFLRGWMEQSPGVATFTFEELWRIREQCIAALGNEQLPTTGAPA
jgi:hypothetical protein